MNRLLQGYANMPAATKIVIAVLALAFAGAIVMIFGGALAIYVVLAGLVVIGLMLGLYRGILSMMAKRKAAPMERSISSNAGMTPLGITEPARRARVDDLRKNFDTGVEKFRAAGKNLYALPWYLLVGEPGSGKTEAVRHCNVGFPPGLQDQLQGVGGTLNMNWWFTNHAVILDTAGRLLFEEVEPGTSSEWQEFLKLLRRNRPNCPVNGMLLVIPAESLIRDTAEQIEKKGGRIAQQLDGIQRILGVRFPVFVLITKCDLINGFREFFDELTDPALQHQVLGWSNPDALDKPFNPELVEEHLRTVQHRLAKRRAGLLQDPINTENARKPRTEQVDALYAFPDAMMRIAPRLKRYLEMIFVSGEWSQRPLFLRGIYFTSSMREGAALDQELAETFGVPVESLPEGRVWERDRAFFLRDLFMNKVFREKGLVTRAVSTRKQQQTRNIAMYGAAAAGLLAVGLFTWFGARSLSNTIVKPAEFWTSTGKVYRENARQAEPAVGASEQYLPIVSYSTRADKDYKYRGGPGDDARALSNLPVPPERRTIAGMAIEIQEQAKKPIVIPGIFRPVAAVLGDGDGNFVESQRLGAARALFEGSILRPIIDTCKINLTRDVADGPLPPEAASAIEQLAKLERACVSASAGGKHPLLNLEPLLRYALRGNNDFIEKGAQKDLPGLQDAYQALYTEETWPPASMRTIYQKLIPDGVARPIGTEPAAVPTPAPIPTPKPPATPPTTPVAQNPTPTPAQPTAASAALKFPLARFNSAAAELSGEELATLRDSIEKARAAGTPPHKRVDAMLKALPTASHPAQICTISVLPKEPPSLGKDALTSAAPFVAVVAAGGEAKSTVPLAGQSEARLTKLRAPGAAFDLKFFASDQTAPGPVATLNIPSKWGGLYLVDHFRGQPVKADDRKVWDVEADVQTPSGMKSVWLRLEFDTELPELPWFP